MKIRVGSYTGNGSARSITGVGTISLLVIRARGTAEAVARPATKTGDAAWKMGTAGPPATGLITSIDVDGFSLGTDASVNGSGTDYDWIAFQVSSGDSYQGTYVGNAVDNRSITGFGHNPAFVIVFRDGSGAQPVWRTSDFGADSSTLFVNTAAITANMVQNFVADGIEVGTQLQANASGITYHVFSCAEIANLAQVFTWTGDGTDNRSIATGFTAPVDWSTVYRSGSSVNLRMNGVTGDNSYRWSSAATSANKIQDHESDGDVQVGSDTSVNLSATTFYGFAFKASPRLDAVEGSFVLSGSLAGLKVSRRVSSVAGAYSVTGGAAFPRAWRGIFAAGGTHAVSGTAATLTKGRRLIAVPGALSLSGTATALRWAHKLAASAGGYLIAGASSSYTILRHELSAAMRAVIDSDLVNGLIEVSEFDFAWGQMRLAPVPYSSTGRGHYLDRVKAYGQVQTVPSGRDGSVGTSETTIDVDDASGELWALSRGRYRNAIVGSRVSRYLAHPILAFADWSQRFDGVITKQIEFPSPSVARFTLRIDDAGLDHEMPHHGWIVDRVSWPNAHVDSLQEVAARIYGTHSSLTFQTAPGFLSTIHLDTLLNIYGVAAGRLKAVDEVFVDDTPQVIGVACTVTNMADRRGRVWTVVVFGSALAAAAVVTVNARGYEYNGDGLGTLIENSADQLAHLLTNFHFGDWKNEPAWLPTSSLIGTSVTAAAGVLKLFLGPRMPRAAPRYRELIDGYGVIRNFCDNHEVRAYWSPRRMLEFCVEDVTVAPYSGQWLRESDVITAAVSNDDVASASSVRAEYAHSDSQDVYHGSAAVMVPDASEAQQETVSLLWSQAG